MKTKILKRKSFKDTLDLNLLKHTTLYPVQLVQSSFQSVNCVSVDDKINPFWISSKLVAVGKSYMQIRIQIPRYVVVRLEINNIL